MKSKTRLTLHANKGKWVGVLLGCAAFVTIANLAGPEGLDGKTLLGMRVPGQVMLMACFIFFGAGALVAALHLVPGASFLRLDQNGFSYRTLWRGRAYRWSEVESFGVSKLRKVGSRGARRRVRTKFVGFNLAQSAEGISGQVARLAGRGLSGFDGILPDTYGESAEELASLMNDWRERFGAS